MVEVANLKAGDWISPSLEFPSEIIPTHKAKELLMLKRQEEAKLANGLRVREGGEVAKRGCVFVDEGGVELSGEDAREAARLDKETRLYLQRAKQAGGVGDNTANPNIPAGANSLNNKAINTSKAINTGTPAVSLDDAPDSPTSDTSPD